MPQLDEELKIAVEAMEASFHVRLIGTFAPDVVWAPADCDAAPWLAENSPEFDQFPVKRDNATVGILLRQGEHAGKTIRQAMQPLSEGIIVSADMPIADLIPQLRASHFRLVLRGSRIDGLVTQSDLIKLPVRMLLFGLISHLELCLRGLVRVRTPWPKWLELLEPERRREVRRKLGTFASSRFEPDPLEFTNLSDVLAILEDNVDLPDNFSAEMDAIRLLRNDIAHAKTYVSSPDDVCQFVDQFGYIRCWIEHVSGMLVPPQ